MNNDDRSTVSVNVEETISLSPSICCNRWNSVNTVRGVGATTEIGVACGTMAWSTTAKVMEMRPNESLLTLYASAVMVWVPLVDDNGVKV